MELQFIQNVVLFCCRFGLFMKILSIFWHDKLINFVEMAYVILVEYNNLQDEKKKSDLSNLICKCVLI